MVHRILWWLFAALALLLNRAFAQEGSGGKTVLDGVYTEAQAKRGEESYNVNCAGCHGDDLTGRVMGPLRGNGFLDLWREDDLAYLFTHIKTRMPGNAAGSLPEKTYLDILAYVLQVNTFPGGSQELTAESVTHIRFVGPGGPQPLSTNALVEVTGCFSGSSGTWILARATEPARTHDAEQITPEELKSAASGRLGSGTFSLQDLEDLPPAFKPEGLQGHKVLTKGVLVRRSGNDRINVISIETVSLSCGP